MLLFSCVQFLTKYDLRKRKWLFFSEIYWTAYPYKLYVVGSMQLYTAAKAKAACFRAARRQLLAAQLAEKGHSASFDSREQIGYLFHRFAIFSSDFVIVFSAVFCTFFHYFLSTDCRLSTWGRHFLSLIGKIRRRRCFPEQGSGLWPLLKRPQMQGSGPNYNQLFRP